MKAKCILGNIRRKKARNYCESKEKYVSFEWDGNSEEKSVSPSFIATNVTECMAHIIIDGICIRQLIHMIVNNPITPSALFPIRQVSRGIALIFALFPFG